MTVEYPLKKKDYKLPNDINISLTCKIIHLEILLYNFSQNVQQNQRK